MKTISSFIFLSLMIFLTSCGAKKTVTNLEVISGALTASNSNYTGGLVIMGKNGSDSFVLPISYLAGGPASTTVELTRGNWTFSAVAWNAGGKFNGDPLCDKIDVDVNEDVENVKFSLTTAKCVSDFSATSFDNTSSIHPLRIITCGWLYTDENALSPVVFPTASDYCKSTAGTPLPLNRREHAMAAKVEIPGFLNGRPLPPLSECITTGINEGVFTTSLGIPATGLPVRIKLYRTNSCDETDPENLRTDYLFPSGLSNYIAGSGSINFGNESFSNTFLTFNPVRAGFSDFISILPKLTCGSGNCNPNPQTVPVSALRLITSGEEFIAIESPLPTQTCSNIDDVIETGFAFSAAFNRNTDCRIDDEGRMRLKLNFTGDILSPGANIEIDWMDASASAFVAVHSTPASKLYDLLYQAVGYNIAENEPPSEIRNSLPSLFEGDEEFRNYGALADVRDMFEVDGPAGALHPLTCTPGVTKEKTVTLNDDGVTKTLKAIFKDSDKVVSAFEADGTHSAGTAYEKSILLRERLANGTFITRARVDFMCASKIGRYESQINEDGYLIRKRIFWNTKNPAVPSTGKISYYRVSEKKVLGISEDYSAEKMNILKVSSGQLRINRYSLKVKKVTAVTWNYAYKKQQLDSVDGSSMGYLETSGQQSLLGAVNSGFTSSINSLPASFEACTSESSGIYQSYAPYSSNCAGNFQTYQESIDFADLLSDSTVISNLFTSPLTFLNMQ